MEQGAMALVGRLRRNFVIAVDPPLAGGAEHTDVAS